MTDKGAYRTDSVKPFCPCDTGQPQDCQPEDWPGAHDEASRPCLNCGRKRYEHHGWPLFCDRPWPTPSTASGLIALPPVTCSHCGAVYDRDDATGNLTHPEPECTAALFARALR